MTPESTLWQEVLLRALRDACGMMPDVSTSLRHLDKLRSAEWMGSRDFYIVCALAGIDAEATLAAWRSGRLKAALEVTEKERQAHGKEKPQAAQARHARSGKAEGERQPVTADMGPGRNRAG